jgi:hypothetical protein
MRTSRVAVGATAAAVVGGGMLLRQLRAAQHPNALDGDVRDRDRDARWRAVTVYREPDEVTPGGQLPPPLATLGDSIETRIRPAPGGKGTELAARLRVPAPSGAAGVAARARGDDPRGRLRAALREAKQLIEVGEVLAVDPTPHGRRSASPLGAALEAATRRAGREGVL